MSGLGLVIESDKNYGGMGQCVVVDASLLVNGKSIWKLFTLALPEEVSLLKV